MRGLFCSFFILGFRCFMLFSHACTQFLACSLGCLQDIRGGYFTVYFE